MPAIHRGMFGCLLAFSLGGCTHTYRPHPDLDRGPTASVQLFTDANIGAVGWYPQIYDYGDRCPGFGSGGAMDGAYLGNVDLRGNQDAIQLEVRAPSNIFFQINLVDAAGTCALFAGFRSEPGHSYRA